MAFLFSLLGFLVSAMTISVTHFTRPQVDPTLDLGLMSAEGPYQALITTIFLLSFFAMVPIVVVLKKQCLL